MIPLEQATALIGSVSDCKVTQVVDVKKGIHCTSSKDASKKLAEPRPTTETADHLVTHAHDADMNKAIDTASWDMIELLQKRKGLTRLDAYSLASIAMDCRVGEMEAAEKSVHCLVPKSLWVNR
jgi:acetamidase/formamidase